MHTYLEQSNAIEKRKKENEEKKKEGEEIYKYQEDKREDVIGGMIKKKIYETDFEDYDIQPILAKIERGDAKSAVSDLIYLEGKEGERIELTDREIKHFSKLPPEIILSWFKKYIERERIRRKEEKKKE